MSCVKYTVRDQHMLALLSLQLIASNCTNEGHEKHESVMGFLESCILFFLPHLKGHTYSEPVPCDRCCISDSCFPWPLSAIALNTLTENRANSVHSNQPGLTSTYPPLPKNTAHQSMLSLMAPILSSYLSQNIESS